MAEYNLKKSLSEARLNLLKALGGLDEKQMLALKKQQRINEKRKAEENAKQPKEKDFDQLKSLYRGFQDNASAKGWKKHGFMKT